LIWRARRVGEKNKAMRPNWPSPTKQVRFTPLFFFVFFFFVFLLPFSVSPLIHNSKDKKFKKQETPT